MWMHEQFVKGGANNTILFAICCMSENVTLPLLPVLLPLLKYTLNKGSAPPMFVISGHNYHSIGSLMPQQPSKSKFAQLYFYDTKNEVQNRIDTIGLSNQHKSIDQTIVADLSSMLDSHNSLAKSFRYARQRFAEDSTTPPQLRLIKKRNTDGRRYNLPSASEVAALIVGDFDTDNLERDVVLQTHSNQLKRIDVDHPQYAGYPSYFITITCNPDWNEIKDCVADYSLKPSDRPDIISRVFKIKLDVVLKDLKDGSIFGKPKGIVYTVEFQKHGLPHCHILLFLQPAEKPRSSDDIDHHISAEIPDEHTQSKLYRLVQKFMTSAIKYLFKYVHKGNDRVTASFFRSHDSADSVVTVDEIQNYYDCRYISACDASWRLFGFEIQFKEPNVIRLPFHFPNEQNILYKDHQLIENVIEAAVSKDSMFIGWFKANKDFDLARTLTYAEMPSFFVWDKQGHMWRPRKQGNVIGCLTHIPHSYREEYYLRLLLNYQKGCQTFADVHSVGGIVYDTFKEACYALGLLQDDKEFIDALNEASSWASPNYIRRLFAMLLMSNNMVRPDMLSSILISGFQRSIHEIQSTILAKIEKLVQPNGKSLKEFTNMPFPDFVDLTEPSDTVFFDELNFDRTELASISVDLVSRLNRD
ncbi:uncharacterized protein [Arachis hypogaea]|uniref:uncharacterized protein n=1 Tax=Arachis hypogaea TaxID=3818 RepID=UPI003B223A6E